MSEGTFYHVAADIFIHKGDVYKIVDNDHIFSVL